VVSGELGPADADLAAAVAAARGEAGDEVPQLTLEEFSSRSGVPASLIQAVEREGIRLGRTVDGEERYTASDIEVVRTALRLLEFGLPLADLLTLAHDTDDALRGLADRAVDLFDEHVRKPIRDTAGDDPRAAEQMVEAFGQLLPAVTDLVSHHFRRVLLESAEAHIEVGEAP
jgi:DNA-binding transcriptional MerR regulator